MSQSQEDGQQQIAQIKSDQEQQNQQQQQQNQQQQVLQAAGQIQQNQIQGQLQQGQIQGQLQQNQIQGQLQQAQIQGQLQQNQIQGQIQQGQLQQGQIQQGQLTQGQIQQGQLTQGQLQQGQIQQVQVIQNQQYLPQLYGGQGGLIMPGNMQIGPMKVITQGQPGTYPTYPGNNQTLVIGQLFSPQQNLLPTTQNAQPKPQDMKPPTQGCVVSSQGQPLTHLISPIQYSNNGRTTVQQNQMQFTPWQFNTLPQGITWATSPQQSIFIGRGTQQDASGQPQQGTQAPTQMFVQQSPPPQQHIQTHQQVAMQQGTTLPQISTTPTTIKTRTELIQPKTHNTICRPLMPNSVRGGPPLNSNQGTLGPKKRTKSVVIRSPLVIPTQKMMDASNQTKLQINNSNNKMIIASTGQLLHPQQQMINTVSSQQIVHASLAGQHMGNTQLTYTMQQAPISQAQYTQQPKPLLGLPLQTQQLVNPQPQQQQQQLQQGQQPHNQQESVQQSVLPQQQSVLPQQQTVIPQQQSVLPQQQSVLPQQQPVLPQQQSVLPQQQSVLPQQQSNVSQQQTSVQQQQQQQSVLPQQQSVLPQQQSVMPQHMVSLQVQPQQQPAQLQPPVPPSSQQQDVITPIQQQVTLPSTSISQTTPSTTNGVTTESITTDANNTKDIKNNTTVSGVGSNNNTNNITNSTQKTTALVKPQILTHVIEGFVIQESDQPFPVNRGVCFDLIGTGLSEEPPMKKQHLDETVTESTPGFEDNKTSTDLISESLTNVQSESSTCPNVPSGNLPNPTKWSVQEVCDFVKSVAGYAEYVEDFAMQEIDGQALVLLEPQHLIQTLSMKLGPALKIVSMIQSMKRAAEGNVDNPPASTA